MKDVIKWVTTPKCKNCEYHNNTYKRCKLKDCAYPNKRWTGNNLKHGGNYGR